MSYLLLESAPQKIQYRKKYPCPYCGQRYEREKLVHHVNRVHDEMIPENYTSTRVVFNLINKKDHGTCVICGGETPWNEDKGRYERFDKKSCQDAYVKMARDRNVNKYGVPNLLQSKEYAIEQQKKMLASRHISGTYKFSDGAVKDYTAKFEKNTLEFMDKVLKCSSIDIETPGPIIYYQYQGKTHFYISDIYYVPYNLVIEVKDGGDNPNTRPMKEYREKQMAKEKAIVEQGQYNYIRLTNNNFEQLLLIFVELKMQLVDNGANTDKIIRINEAGMVGTIAAALASPSYEGIYMTQTLQNNVFAYGTTKDPSLDNVIEVKDGKLRKKKKKEMTSEDTVVFEVVSEDAKDMYNSILDTYKKGITVDEDFIYKTYTEGSQILTDDQIYFDEHFRIADNMYKTLEEVSKIVKESLFDNPRYSYPSKKISDNVSEYMCEDGKYLYNSKTDIRTPIIDINENFTDIQSIIIEEGEA